MVEEGSPLMAMSLRRGEEVCSLYCLEEHDRSSGCQASRVPRQTQQVDEEEGVVGRPYTIVNPRAVVVVSGDTPVADGAVATSIWPD